MKRRIYQLTIIIVSLLIIQGLSRDLVELWGQKQRLQDTEEELARLEQEETELKRQLEYYNSEEYIEKIAREKLLLGKEGETVILLPESENDGMTNGQLPIANGGTEKQDLSIWEKLRGLLGF